MLRPIIISHLMKNIQSLQNNTTCNDNTTITVRYIQTCKATNKCHSNLRATKLLALVDLQIL